LNLKGTWGLLHPLRASTGRRKEVNMLEKVISGGQTGADQGGLRAAHDAQVETGGTAPPGFFTEEGRNLALRDIYGLIEGGPDPRTYPRRTVKNVQDSDGTVWFGNTDSPGARLTLNTCGKLGKVFLTNPGPSVLARWIIDNNIRVLNVAGNRASHNVLSDRMAYITLASAIGLLDGQGQVRFKR